MDEATYKKDEKERETDFVGARADVSPVGVNHGGETVGIKLRTGYADLWQKACDLRNNDIFSGVRQDRKAPERERTLLSLPCDRKRNVTNSSRRVSFQRGALGKQ